MSMIVVFLHTTTPAKPSSPLRWHEFETYTLKEPMAYTESLKPRCLEKVIFADSTIDFSVEYVIKISP
jgi:hypothetical protein